MFLRGCAGLVLGAVLSLAAPAQAALIVGFEFADGSTNKVVPLTGGSYVVNVVATTNTPTTTNIGVNAGYIGALSQILNGSILDGDVTASTLAAGLGTTIGVLSDVNADGRIDLGFANGISKGTTGWMRPTTGGVSAQLLGAAKGIIGTFTVNIPASLPTGLSFLSYLPQIDPTGAGADWSWSESNAGTPLISGSIGGTVSVGTSVTFSAVPEPGTMALGGVLLAGLAGWKLRRKKA